MNGRWVAACAVAEGLGMAGSAAAARTADGLTPPVGLAVVVGGGLVEGTALGLTQSYVLGPTLGQAGRRVWVLATILVAGLGWAAGSAPAALSDSSDGTTPALGVVLLGAAGLGLSMGALLGGAQALALRNRVRHPWRWVAASTMGWAVAMPVIFAGATTAGASWSLARVVAYGALVGLVAGACLGLVTSAWLDTFHGPALHHQVVLRALATMRRQASSGVTALAVTGTRTGRVFRFPVMSAPMRPSSLVVLPGHPDRKTWWHQLRTETPVEVLDGGVWVAARAHVVERGSLQWSVARSAYLARWPRVRIEDQPFVVVDLHPALVVADLPGRTKVPSRRVQVP